MAYWVNHLMGKSSVDYSLDLLGSLYDELSDADSENTDVSLTHESEWCLSAFSSGLVIWENVAGEGEPKHMSNLARENVIKLWKLLSTGNISDVDQEQWQPGYGN